jgi:hypothetical protein
MAATRLQGARDLTKVARPPRCIYSNFISSLNYSTITTMHTYVITLSALLTLSFFI